MKVSFFSPINQTNDMRSAAEGDNPISASPNAQWPVPPAFYDKKRGHEGFKKAIEEVQAAEDLGFDWMSYSEHHYGFGGLTPVTTVPAAAMAAHTKKIKIAIMGPVMAINNPVRMAEEIAIVDNISDGRVIVGLLRGTPNEFNVYSVNPAETRERAAECMALMLKCWQEPVPFSWEGRHFRFRTVAVWPQPYQEPIPPTYVLGYHHESIETAAKNHLGMGISFHLPDVFLPAVEHYRARCAYYGWEPGPEQIIYRGRLHIAETDQQAEEEINGMFTRGRMGNRPGANSVSRAIWAANPTPISGPDLKAYWEGKPKEAVLSQTGNAAEGMPRANFHGSPASVLKQIKEYSDALNGFGVIDLMIASPGGTPGDLLKRMELFADEVIPALHEMP
jgi:alkanesulfonate monooxygenase SsuD/methylene tetrahydromethanopterin reductase-like flavin-dependent oxidoreductase (luciferase family)